MRVQPFSKKIPVPYYKIIYVFMYFSSPIKIPSSPCISVKETNSHTIKIHTTGKPVEKNHHDIKIPPSPDKPDETTHDEVS